MNEQQRVATFIEEYDLRGEPAFRVLDLAAEVGEIAADATKSTDWGTKPSDLDVETDEIGDALFSLLAVAESLDIDAGDALDESLAKYEKRIEGTGSASSDS
ncbi:MazG nucleotide pyrophosphohydrolase domain-containing protein [Halococcus saccharolyticus]|uniref:Nucleotide pyrophosphohydrolase n=1 Tax=Halococcus saccharolyticus DSM 5350 TaxID=1227455 RepID=M0MEL7_9EURY|nr:MazG nucleotide pyrophosphohydrolase domain-containing protein [Halococcus saccharolyticus]EMA44171.1 nucleotide pyrophosphohydrolase [Halococcus saccharolyticus DSM 5350]